MALVGALTAPPAGTRGGLPQLAVPHCPSNSRSSGTRSLANWAARTSHPNREALRRKNLWSAVGLWLRHCGIPYLFPSLVKPRVVGDRMQDLEGGDRISDCAV